MEAVERASGEKSRRGRAGREIECKRESDMKGKRAGFAGTQGW